MKKRIIDKKKPATSYEITGSYMVPATGVELVTY